MAASEALVCFENVRYSVPAFNTGARIAVEALACPAEYTVTLGWRPAPVWRDGLRSLTFALHRLSLWRNIGKQNLLTWRQRYRGGTGSTG